MNFPPPLPRPQGTAEHRSSLPLHIQPRASDTPTCISHNQALLLLSQAAFSLPSSPPPGLSFFILITGWGRSQQQSQSHQMRRSNKVTLCRRQKRELASPYPLEASDYSSFPPSYSKDFRNFQQTRKQTG